MTTSKTPTERLLQITPGTFAFGSYRATDTFIERLREEPQAAVMLYRPGMVEGESGMLMAVCGDLSDPVSNREAVLYAAAPELFDVAVNLVDYFADLANAHILLTNPVLRELVAAAKKASMKAIIDVQTPEEALARF
jgi:hypothetical protein